MFFKLWKEVKDKVYVDLNVFDGKNRNNDLDIGQYKRAEPQVRDGVCG